MTIFRKLPYQTSPVEYFEKLRHFHPYPVLLDSGQPSSEQGRFDIMAASPVKTISLAWQKNAVDPFESARDLLHQHPFEGDKALAAEVPFVGGIIGFFGYDLARSQEQLPELINKELNFPDLHLGLYLWAIVLDHHVKACWLVAQPSAPSKTLDEICTQLTNPITHANQPPPFELLAPFESNISKEHYCSALKSIHNYILAGDCYQINYAQRFSAPFSGDPWLAYKGLRETAPTPFSAYIELKDGAILSFSPERFLKLEERQVSTKPIKGTRPRSHIPSEDEALKQALVSSEKERAENLMIVDLLRNDLSKVCELGSIKVPKLFNIESFSNVHHLVSTVEGRLKKGKDALDLLSHCFPGGSITGAPKVRAMEIIEELETDRRSIYCGSVGYISFCGKMDTNIAIRTLLCHQDKAYCWAGGGIVADSETEAEYQETFNKVNNLLKTLEK